MITFIVCSIHDDKINAMEILLKNQMCMKQ